MIAGLVSRRKLFKNSYMWICSTVYDIFQQLNKHSYPVIPSSPFQSNSMPWPGRSGAMAKPSSIRSGSAM